MIPESLWINSVLAIGSFIFALVLILFFINIEAKNKEIKLKSKKIFVSISKHSVEFGVVFIIIGVVFLIPILLGSERIFLFDQIRLKNVTKPPSQLIPYGYLWSSKVPPFILGLNSAYFNIRFFGFLLLGFFMSLIGISIVFPRIFTEQKKFLMINKFELNAKKSMVFALITLLFLFLVGYLMYLNYLDYEWMANGWNFGGFNFFNSLSEDIFFISLLIAVIVFIPLIVLKIGFLDNPVNQSQISIVKNNSNLKEVQNFSNRFINFLKSAYIVIKNYMLPVGFILVILGGCFMILPSRFLLDSYPDFVLESGEVFIQKYYGLIRGQLLLIGVPFLVLGYSFIICYVLEAKKKEPKLAPNKILAFIYNFSTIFGTFFVIIGSLFLATTLIPFGTNIFWFDWYIKNYFWFWYIRIPLLISGFLFVGIGLILIIHRYMFRNHE